MRTFKTMFAFSFCFLILSSCHNTTAKTQDPTNDTTATSPTNNALDYHNDQRQTIPVPDSSSVIGTDTLNSSASAPNTGTMKSYNDSKGKKDSMKHK